jgi:hypothetical protein
LQPTKAAQVNQFLGTHQANFIYVGVSQGSSTTLAGTGTNSNGLYIAQQFTPGSTQTIQRWLLNLSVTGSPTPLTFTIQTNNSGAPSGTVLSTTLIPADYLTGTAANVSVPTAPVTFTGATTYWFVLNAVGDASDYFTVGRTTATSGASTSTNGTSWSAQTYGLYYNRFDATATGNLTHTYEDSGARWTTFLWNANNTPSGLDEYTLAQGSNAYLYSGRSFTYSTSGSLTLLS